MHVILQCDVMTHGKNREEVTRALQELGPRSPLRDVQFLICGRLLKGRHADKQTRRLQSVAIAARSLTRVMHDA